VPRTHRDRRLPEIAILSVANADPESVYGLTTDSDRKRPLQPKDQVHEVRPEPLHAPQIRELIIRVDGFARQADGFGDRTADSQPELRVGLSDAFRAKELGIRQQGALRFHVMPLPPLPGVLATDLVDNPHQGMNHDVECHDDQQRRHQEHRHQHRERQEESSLEHNWLPDFRRQGSARLGSCSAAWRHDFLQADDESVNAGSDTRTGT
jgi:hypothetical protein